MELRKKWLKKKDVLRWLKIPGLYELKDKLNRCKKKNKEDAFEFQSIIKRQNELIEALKERNRTLKAREMYQIWLKEREAWIKKVRENDKLLDEINELKKKLTNEIELSIKDPETEVMRKKWLIGTSILNGGISSLHME